MHHRTTPPRPPAHPRPQRPSAWAAAACTALMLATWPAGLWAQGAHQGRQHGGHSGSHAPHGAGTQPTHGASAGHGAAPYAGWQARDIKALSAQQVEDLQAGRGMSMALPAELNGYPGPAHVLELAGELALSAQQQAAVQASFQAMQKEAQTLGLQVIDAERALDTVFRDRKADPHNISRLTRAAAQAHADLRAAHLRYHLDMMTLLDAEQVARYQRLRGY